MITSDLTKEFNELEWKLKKMKEMGGQQIIPEGLKQELLKRIYERLKKKKGVKIVELPADISTTYWTIIISVDGRSLDWLNTHARAIFSLNSPQQTLNILEKAENELCQKRLKIQNEENEIAHTIDDIDTIIRIDDIDTIIRKS